MSVGIAGLERNPAGKPLGQSRLQAVVVGTRIVHRLVDELQIGEFRSVGADAGRRIELIKVAAAGQSVAVIANIADVQRKIVGEGVLDTDVPVHGVGGLEIRVHGLDAAGYGRCTTECGAVRKNNVIPVEDRARENRVGGRDGAAKSCWARRPRKYSNRAGPRGNDVDAATTEALGAGLHPLGWGVQRINDAGSAPEYCRSPACDIPVKTNAWREVLVIGLKNTIEARLPLLNQSLHRIEAAQQAVGFFERRYVGPAQTQSEHEFRSDAPVILKERRGRRPVQLSKRLTNELKCLGWLSGEEIFQWRGTCERLSAQESDSATRVVEVVVGVDVRELAAKLEAVLAPQIREIVRKIENRVGEPTGTAHPTAQNLPGKTGNIEIREPTRARDAGVEGIVLAIGEFAGVVRNQVKVQVVEAKAEVVQQAGAGSPNPIRRDRIGAYWISVLPV